MNLFIFNKKYLLTFFNYLFSLTVLPLEYCVDVVRNTVEHAHVPGIVEFHVVLGFVEPVATQLLLN